VLEDAVNDADGCDQQEDLAWATERDQSDGAGESQPDRIDRMEAGCVEEIQSGGAVVEGVEPPEQADLVACPVRPVVAEFVDDQGQGPLSPERPCRWPDTGPVGGGETGRDEEGGGLNRDVAESAEEIVGREEETIGQ
jgi:hypothetical protein